MTKSRKSQFLVAVVVHHINFTQLMNESIIFHEYKID